MAEHQGGHSEASEEAAQPLLGDLESQQLWGSAPSLDVSKAQVCADSADSAACGLHLGGGEKGQDGTTFSPSMGSFPSTHKGTHTLALFNPCVPRRWRGLCPSRATCHAFSHSTRPA